MKALVLCGGFGSRLGPLTAQCPKPLLDLGGETLLDHILGQLRRHEVTEVFINLHHLPEVIVRYLEGRHPDLHIEFIHEETLLGTAGTPALLASRLGEDSLLVHYGDIVSTHDLSGLEELHDCTGAAATLVVHQRQRSNSCARLQGNRVLAFWERPAVWPLDEGELGWVFSGICVLAPALVRSLPHGPGRDLARDVFPELAARGRLFADPLVGYRTAVDSSERLDQVRRDALRGLIEPPVFNPPPGPRFESRPVRPEEEW